jgi:ubiquinone/menaquinone biosynthesis C-methylase UbiE
VRSEKRGITSGVERRFAKGEIGMIQGAAEIRDAYRADEVAREYVERRFRQPLFAMLHDRQVRTVVDLVRRERPARILEIAPGPARVTLDVARACTARGVIVDASLQMLGEARRRLDGFSARWRAVQGDAFALPVAGPVDLVYSFRLVRHFERHDRRRLYGEIARVLRLGGWFVFDAVNEKVSAPLRAAAPSEYQHFDALMTPAELEAELNEAGLRLVALSGVQHRMPVLGRLQVLVAPRSARLARWLMERVDSIGGEPLEWIVVCRRA